MQLYEHQEEAVAWMVQREHVPDRHMIRGGLLCDEMGLGKTRTCLATIYRRPVQTLVLCPLALVGQWKREAMTVLKEFDVAVMYHPTDNVRMTERIIIMSHTCLTALHPEHEVFSFTFGRVIIDEGHKAKSTTSRLWRAVCDIDAICRWIVTGTPIVTTMIPARSAMSTAHKSKDLRAYLKMLQPAITLREIREIEQSTEIQETIMKRRLKSIFQFTPLRIEVCQERLSTHEQAEYDAIYREGTNIVSKILSKNDRSGDEQDEQTTNEESCQPSTLYECLENLAETDGTDRTDRATGTVDDSGDSTDTQVDSKTGLDSLDSLLPILTKLRKFCATCPSKMELFEHDMRQMNYPHNRCLVFCSFHAEIQAASQRARKHVPVVMEFHGGVSVQERTEMVDVFMSNDPSPMCMIVQIMCGGCGLNLQAAKHVFLLSPNWSAAFEDQAIARAHRLNTKHTVFVKKYIIEDSLESFMHTRSNQKRKTAQALLGDTVDSRHEPDTWTSGKLFESQL